MSAEASMGLFMTVTSTVAASMSLTALYLHWREPRHPRPERKVTITVEDAGGVRSCTLSGESSSTRELHRGFQRLIDDAA